MNFSYEMYWAWSDKDLAAASMKKAMTDKCCLILAHSTGFWSEVWVPTASRRSVNPEKLLLEYELLELGANTM